MILTLAGLFAGSFTLGLSGALMPGPVLTVTVADSARRGFVSGPLIAAGHAILELALVAGVILGAGPVLKIPIVMGTVALVGGGVLAWMGAGMIRSSVTVSLNTESDERGVACNPALAGMLTSVSNPYWILWWTTVGLGYLLSAMKMGIAGVVFFFIGHISADFLWYSLISFSVSRGRKVISDGVYRAVIRVCGLILIVFGGWFLYAAFGYLK